MVCSYPEPQIWFYEDRSTYGVSSENILYIRKNTAAGGSRGTGIDWRERRLISNLYMAQSVSVHLNQEETSGVKTGKESYKGAVCH
jgi:hypothetical protein